MEYLYILADHSSAFFEFGVASLNDGPGVWESRPSCAKNIFPCDNARAVESAVKQALANHIQSNDSGRRSEICSKGVGNIHLIRAFNLVCAMTMEPHDDEWKFDREAEEWLRDDEVEQESKRRAKRKWFRA